MGFAFQVCALVGTRLPIHAMLTEALIRDDVRTLRAFLPFIRAMNAHLVQHKPREDLHVYRGCVVPLALLTRLREKGSYRAMHFTATSKSRAVTTNFLRKLDVDDRCQRRALVKFHIPRPVATTDVLWKARAPMMRRRSSCPPTPLLLAL